MGPRTEPAPRYRAVDIPEDDEPLLTSTLARAPARSADVGVSSLVSPSGSGMIKGQATSGAMKDTYFGVSSIALSGGLYVLSSASLVLLNKHALASFGFQCPNSLIAFHCILAVVLVKGCEAAGLIRLEPIRWTIVKVWFPVNLLFVGMIVTSFFSLRLIGVGMFTVLKNLSNFMTIMGDWYFFGRTYSTQVWLCLVLMALSAAVGGLTDTNFSVEGYTWQLLNCVFTSAYSLYLSGAMDRVAPHTGSKERMTEFSMLYYNNLLSLGPIAILVLLYGEHVRLPYEASLLDPNFQVVALIGGLFGFGISFASLWYMSRSTATVFSLTGSLNKVLVAVAGIMIFHEASSLRNLASIAVGLVAGCVFVLAKSHQAPK